jgi:hypothetical protein
MFQSPRCPQNLNHYHFQSQNPTLCQSLMFQTLKRFQSLLRHRNPNRLRNLTCRTLSRYQNLNHRQNLSYLSPSHRLSPSRCQIPSLSRPQSLILILILTHCQNPLFHSHRWVLSRFQN